MRNLAKKILFLYPHSVVQGQMIDLLIQAEFEVAILKDHQKAMRLINKFPSSILFLNIEEHLKSDEWEVFCRNIIQGESIHDTKIGIMVYNPDKNLAEKYLIDIGAQCGFITLKLGLTESTKIIMKALMANEAKGDRKYIRVKVPNGKASLNIKTVQEHINGTVLDVSSAGFACNLDKFIENGTEFNDIQLSLRGSIIKVSGKVVGRRTQDGRDEIYVIMFNTVSREIKGKLYNFIKKTLQTEIDDL